MRRQLTFLLALATLFSLTACGGTTSAQESPAPSESSQMTETPASEPSGDLATEEPNAESPEEKMCIRDMCIGANQFVADTQLGGSRLKESGTVLFAGKETVGELNAVVGLNALHSDTPAGVPLDQLFQKVGRGIGGLLGIGCKETQTSKFIHGGILEQPKFRISDAAAGNHLHVHLDPLSRISPVSYTHLDVYKRQGPDYGCEK